MGEVFFRTRASKDPNDGFQEESIGNTDVETLFSLTVASFAREAVRLGENLAPGEARKKALNLFHELANKENEEFDKRHGLADLYAVASGETGGVIDPVKALGDYALHGGVAILPSNETGMETL